MKTRALLVLAALASTACGGDASAGSRSVAVGKFSVAASESLERTGLPAAPVATPAELLASFRAGLVAPRQLSGGATSRDALVRRFARAVQRRDTSAVRAMVIDRAEFAFLYYPTSPYNRPPVVQEAPLAWFLLLQHSQTGITRVFNRIGGQSLTYVGYSCLPVPLSEDRNRFWTGCLVSLKTPDGTVATRRLFGTIIERDGQLKFLSYANDF